MGVIYKLKEEVVHFIISQRQSNPLASCRQLAESTSQKFGLHLSKSSVHDVLKESGIVTPRGRKPKDKFEIPQEKKKQIQVGLSQVKLNPPLEEDGQAKEIPEVILPTLESKIILIADVADVKNPVQDPPDEVVMLPPKSDFEISAEYEGAGRVFLKAMLWDLGIFEENKIDFPMLQEIDWNYYLTYSKGIKVVLENNKDFFIDLPLPLERCIREAADGLINNTKPFIVHKVSDQELFKSCMNAQADFKINFISIVDQFDHVLLELNHIMEFKRDYIALNRVFMESNQRNILERSKTLFLSQTIDNNDLIEDILNLKGFDATNKDKNVVTLLIDNDYERKDMLQGAVEKLNGMYLRDEQGRWVSVKVEDMLLP